MFYYNTVERKYWRECSHHLMFCVAFTLRQGSFFSFFFIVVIVPLTALCSLTWQLLVIVVVFSGNEKVPGLGCTRVEYERHKIHAKLFFPLFFRIDKYRSCWLIHAFGVFVEVHLWGVFNVLELGMTTCWGLLASLARFLLPQALFKAHDNKDYLKRNVYILRKSAAHVIIIIITIIIKQVSLHVHEEYTTGKTRSCPDEVIWSHRHFDHVCIITGFSMRNHNTLTYFPGQLN